jgi:hypothetical protein
MKAQILALDPASYVPHPIHREERAWAETNCWVDLWIELLYSLGLEPVACMGFTVGLDFEGDQWLFFKFPLADLWALYGVDVQELNIWRSLVHHVFEQVRLGRPAIVEVDAFYLPDTAGTSYRTEHIKTSVAVMELDLEARRLGYFHNAGYFALDGENFTQLFRLDAPPGGGALPPYVEFCKLDGLRRLPEAQLVARSVALLGEHLRRRPRHNPVSRYAERFLRDLDWLRGEELALFHAYAFATIRQCGACWEQTARYLRWLEVHGEAGLSEVATHFDNLSSTAKALQFKTARAVRKKDVEVAPLEAMLREMAAAWDAGMSALGARYGG